MSLSIFNVCPYLGPWCCLMRFLRISSSRSYTPTSSQSAASESSSLPKLKVPKLGLYALHCGSDATEENTGSTRSPNTDAMPLPLPSRVDQMPGESRIVGQCSCRAPEICLELPASALLEVRSPPLVIVPFAHSRGRGSLAFRLTVMSSGLGEVVLEPAPFQQ